jgi:hypothetical protein
MCLRAQRLKQWAGGGGGKRRSKCTGDGGGVQEDKLLLSVSRYDKNKQNLFRIREVQAF